MARDISELGADVYDDTPKQGHRISPKKRNYIIGLSVLGVILAGAITGSVIAVNSVLLDYSNMDNVTYYYTPKNLLAEGEEPTAVLYKLKSDKKYKSTFRIPNKVQGYKVVGVADKAFIGHSEIKKVIMPSTLKFVGEEAFKDCTNLSKFTWSKSLEDVGLNAFENTAFYKKLSNYYVLPSGTLIFVSKDYFQPNTALVSDEISDADINVIKSNYAVSNVVRFGTLKSNNIAAGVFKGNTKLSFVDLPDKLDAISKYTFDGCVNLKGIEGKHSKLTRILDNAFANCTSLKDIDLPSGLKTLGSRAFANTAIVDTIPDLSVVENLGEGIFENCLELKSVIYRADTVPHYTFNGCESLESILWGEGNGNIDNVNYFGISAFAGTKFSSFAIPKNVSILYDETFKDCTSLASVSLWANASGLVQPGIYLNASGAITRYSEKNPMPSVTVAAISSNGSNVKWESSDETVVSINVKEAGSGADVTLTPLAVGESEITATATIDGKEYSETILYQVSDNEKTVDTVYREDYPTYVNSASETVIGILRGITEIKDGSFNGCTALATIDLYGDSYEYYAGNPNEFTFPASLEKTEGSSGASIASYTFLATAPTKVTFGPNVRSIGSYAFATSPNLTQVIFTDAEHSSLHTIGEDAFLDCTKLESIDLPSQIGTNDETVGLSPSVFKNCTNLVDVGLGDTQITSIQSYLFYNCQKLATLDIPQSVNIIKNDAFYRNYELNYVIIPKDVTNLNENAFKEMREIVGDKMPIYFDCTLEQARKIETKGDFEINPTWRDDTVECYFLESGPHEAGHKYWDGNRADPQPIP